MTALSMNLVIQMMMLIAGAVMLMACKVNASAISNGAVFKAGMVAIFSVFGVAWMSDTFFRAHLDELKLATEGVVKSHPWTYAIVLFLVSKLVNSRAAALTAVAPMGLMLGIDPKMLIAFSRRLTAILSCRPIPAIWPASALTGQARPASVNLSSTTALFCGADWGKLRVCRELPAGPDVLLITSKGDACRRPFPCVSGTHPAA